MLSCDIFTSTPSYACTRRSNAVSVRTHYCQCWGASLLWKHVCMHQVTSEVTRRASRPVSYPPVPLPTTGNSSQAHLVLFPVCTCGLKPLMSVFAHADAPMPTFSHRIQKARKKVWKCIQNPQSLSSPLETFPSVNSEAGIELVSQAASLQRGDKSPP